MLDGQNYYCGGTVGQNCGGNLHGNDERGCVLWNGMCCDLGNLSVRYSDFLHDEVFVCQHGFLDNCQTCDGDDDDGMCQYKMNHYLVQGYENESLCVFQCGSHYENVGASVLKVKCYGDQDGMSYYEQILDGRDDGVNSHFGTDGAGQMWEERTHNQNDGDAILYRIVDSEFLSGMNDEI